MSRRGEARGSRSRVGRVGLLIAALLALVFCATVAALTVRYNSQTPSRRLTFRVGHTPEKEELWGELVEAFNDTDPRLPGGKRVTVETASMAPEELAEAAVENSYQAISPDSSIWLAEMDRAWREMRGTETGLVGDTTRYMISPVVIAMWRDVAASMGYPGKELGWGDLLQAADRDSSFKWSHPSTTTASGLLATLAEFYAGAGITRGLTDDVATARETLEYVGRLEKTVKHYGEGELALMEQIQENGRDYLDAFVVQEQMVVQHNMRHDNSLVAIYPAEGTMWEDHPLALLEHPDRTDEERLAYRLLRDFLLSPDTQMLILRHGYRPSDLTISLDHPDSPIKLEYGADPAKPYTTMQIPSPAVIAVVKDSWWYTKRHTNVYLVVDVSGSMEGRKLADAQAALKTFLDQIKGDLERVGLITFASNASEAVPLTQLGEGRDRLEVVISGLRAGGNTALLDGVELALTKLQDLHDSERINAIVVMTDGKENRSRTNLRALAGDLRDASSSGLPVVVFCIAYGRDADLEVLETVSDASAGLTKRGDLETIKTLYKTLSTYF